MILFIPLVLPPTLATSPPLPQSGLSRVRHAEPVVYCSFSTCYDGDSSVLMNPRHSIGTVPVAFLVMIGQDELKDALEGMDFIVVPAGVPRKPGMTRDDLFNINAGIVANVAKAASEVAPDAAYLIISNPINSTVPIFAEVLKQAGKSLDGVIK